MQVDFRRMRFADTGVYHAYTRASFNDLQDMLYAGRISQRDYDLALKLWDWSAHHLSSAAQDRVYARAGMAGIDRRIARCNRLRAAIIAKRFAYCAV